MIEILLFGCLAVVGILFGLFYMHAAPPLLVLILIWIGLSWDKKKDDRD